MIERLSEHDGPQQREGQEGGQLRIVKDHTEDKTLRQRTDSRPS